MEPRDVASSDEDEDMGKQERQRGTLVPQEVQQFSDRQKMKEVYDKLDPIQKERFEAFRQSKIEEGKIKKVNSLFSYCRSSRLYLECRARSPRT